MINEGLLQLQCLKRFLSESKTSFNYFSTKIVVIAFSCILSMNDITRTGAATFNIWLVILLLWFYSDVDVNSDTFIASEA